MSVRAVVVGGGAILVVAGKFPENIRSIYFLKVSSRQVSGQLSKKLLFLKTHSPFPPSPSPKSGDLKLGLWFCPTLGETLITQLLAIM